MAETPAEHDGPPIMIPDLCAGHQRELVVRLSIGPEGPWRTAMIIAQILLFQAASDDRRVWTRAESDAGNLSLVLAELGCLACWKTESWVSALRVLGKGLSHAAQVSRGARIDPDWPLSARLRQHGRN